MRKEFPYIERQNSGGFIYYRLLRPTRRWRIVFDRDEYNGHLEIEHRGWILRRWIHENSILFMVERLVLENKCNK